MEPIRSSPYSAPVSVIVLLGPIAGVPFPHRFPAVIEAGSWSIDVHPPLVVLGLQAVIVYVPAAPAAADEKSAAPAPAAEPSGPAPAAEPAGPAPGSPTAGPVPPAAEDTRKKFTKKY